MPNQLIACVSLPPATIFSIPIYDYAEANEELANKGMEEYYSCCGKAICGGCVDSFYKSGNEETCPFCNSERIGKTDEERVKELMKRVDINDASAMYALGSYYHHGEHGLQQDQERAKEVWTQAAKLGFSKAHYSLGNFYGEGGNSKKAKVHYEAAAMAGHEVARYNLGCMEYKLGNKERAVKHWTIAASAGHHTAMNNLLVALKRGLVSRESIDSTLAAYNNSCAEMRSEARDNFIRLSR
jgi:TPR repeat protein